MSCCHHWRLRGSSPRQKQVKQALFSQIFGFQPLTFGFFGLDHEDRQFNQIADHALDVAADIADFSELAGFNLDERSLRQACQASGDLGFAHPGRADHDDVLRRNLVTQIRRDLLAAPAIAQGDRDRALGVILTDDIAIELGDDFAWRKVVHVRVSTII